MSAFDPKRTSRAIHFRPVYGQRGLTAVAHATVEVEVGGEERGDLSSSTTPAEARWSHPRKYNLSVDRIGVPAACYAPPSLAEGPSPGHTSHRYHLLTSGQE
jgi:hypothetical protein